MYSQFFGLESNPFSQTPPTKNNYLPSGHGIVLDQLKQAIKVSSGLFLLLGPIGVGKSSLIKLLVDSTTGLEITDLTLSSTLQSSISASLDLAKILKSISSTSHEDNSKQRTTIFLLDNVSLYDRGLIKILLRKVSERNKNKLHTLLILTGQAELEVEIEKIQLEIRCSLLMKVFYLKSFGNLEIKDYINNRLRCEGYTKNTIFTDDAIQRMAMLSKGLPRVINTICGISIFQASLEELSIINDELIEKASGFCFLEENTAAKDEPLSLKESIQEITSQSIHNAAIPFDNQTDLIEEKTVDSHPQPYRFKNLNDNKIKHSLLTSSSSTKQEYTTAKKVIFNSADESKNYLLNLSPTIPSKSTLENKAKNPEKTLKKPIFSVVTILMLLAFVYWELNHQYIKPKSEAKQFAAINDNKSSQIDNIDLVTTSVLNTNKPVNTKQHEITADEIKEPLAQLSETKLAINISSPKINNRSLNKDQKKTSTVKTVDLTLKSIEIKKNRLSKRDAKKTNIANLKREKKVSIKTIVKAPKKIKQREELAAKKRSSARYKLSQKGINYDLKSYFSSAEKGNNALLKLFLDANMPIDIQDKLTRSTVLIKAAKRGYLDVVKTVLAHKAKVNIQNREGKTALISSIERGHFSISRKLLSYGANVHIRDNKDRDALLLAVKLNKLAIVKVLLKHGANKHTRDATGLTALVLAKNNKRYEMVSLLENSN